MEWSVYHIPEQCRFNSFIERTEMIQRSMEIKVLQPKICYDGFAGASNDLHQLIPVAKTKRVIIHFHWPEKLYRETEKENFFETLDILKKLGTLFVYTVHNLRPHEQVEEEDWLQRLLEYIDCYIVFSYAQKEYISSTTSKRVEVVPHPNYVISLDGKKNRVEDKEWRFLLPGRIRGYKHYEHVIGALKLIKQDIVVKVVGKPDDPKIIELLKEYGKTDPRLICIDEFLPEKEFTELFFDIDVVVLPYPEIWNSGVAVMAGNTLTPIIGAFPMMFADYRRQEIGLFSSESIRMNDKLLASLIQNALCIGKEKMKAKAENLWNALQANDDRYIGEKYYHIYDTLVNGEKI